MDSKELQAKWPQIKGKIINDYPELKEEDLVYEIGKEEQLLRQLAEKLKMNKTEMDKWLSMMG